MRNASTDPRGWLQACPELERFSTDPGVAAAIGKGDGFALMRALRVRRKAGRGPGDERAIDAILAKRRLFVMPLSGAPSLFTFNGIGTRMVGKSDETADGSFIGTLFFTFLFVPIWPIAQYLVASEGSKVLFFGKLPLSSTLRAWRVAVLGLVVLLAGVLGYGRWEGSRTQLVHLLNGLDVPVVVEAGGERYDVAARDGELAVELPTGRQRVRATTKPDGRLVEELDLEIPAYTRLVAYSVLGAAPLVLETVYYGPEPAGGPAPPTVLAGQTFVTLPGVDLVFETAPQSIQAGQGGGTRTRAWAPPGGWRVAVELLRQQAKRPADAERLARAVLRVLPRADGALGLATGLAYEQRGIAGALEVAEEAVQADPDHVDAHRLRQEYLEALGRKDDAKRIYRELEARRPDSPAAVYLRARVEDGPESDRLLEAGLARFPEDPNLLRATGWTQQLAGRTAAAVLTWEKLERVDPAAAAEVVELRARALASLGRGADAAALVARHLDASPDFSGALFYARVARLAPAPPRPPRHYLEALQQQASPGERVLLRTVSAAVLGDPLPTPKDVGEIPDPEVRTGALLLLEATTRPAEAVKALAGATRPQVSYVDPTLRLLLGAEAARTAPDLVPPLVADIDGVPGLAELVVRFVKGEDPPALAELPSEHRTALLAGRARALEAAGKDARAVHAEIRRRELVPGIVSVALARWPKVEQARTDVRPPSP